uniref:Uncharacterized protein n=1 Tax=viral metagenome TaxID=1070528 RepID=A0A6C0K071_9ZZZZ
MEQSEPVEDYHQKIVSDINNIKYVKLNDNTYCITHLVEDLEWLANTIHFSKAFSDYLVYMNKPKNSVFLECPIDSIITNNNVDIVEKSPFLKYKECVKSKYRNLVIVLKHLYENALVLPDAERVIHTINNVFHMENDIYLKHPDFIMDHFIYHTFSHSHISENYEQLINVIKVFEYLYYKTMNYVAELEFDAESYIQPTE